MSIYVQTNKYSYHEAYYMQRVGSTYNRPVALERCLISLFQQTHLPTEIIICDDGSAEPTRQLIERMQSMSPVPMQHVWQPDDGFQLARIRNMGMAVATGAYIIQIDGDVILHPHFVKDHLHHAQPGFFFSGTQYHLSPETTQRLLDDANLSLTEALRQIHWYWPRPTSFKACSSAIQLELEPPTALTTSEGCSPILSLGNALPVRIGL